MTPVPHFSPTTGELTEAQLQWSHLSMLNAMTTGLIHDINNPLSGILGYSQYLIRKTDIPEFLLEPLKDICAESTRLNQIVSSFAQLCRREGGISIFLLDTAVHDVLRFHRKTFAQRGVHLEERIVENIQTASRRNLVQQAVSHLLTHVVETLPGDATEFEIAVELSGEPIRFSVFTRGPLKKRQATGTDHLDMVRALVPCLQGNFELVPVSDTEEIHRITFTSSDRTVQKP